MKKQVKCAFYGMIVIGGLVGCQSNTEVMNENSNIEDIQLGEETIELTVWGSDSDSELLNQLVEDFKKQYASEAKFDISIEFHSESNCKDDLFGNVLDGPDVFTFADDQLRTMVAAGVMDKLSEQQEVENSNIPSAIEAASINETLYAYPLTADNGYFLYYNKEYFSEEDVQSMDKLLERAKVIGKKVSMDWSSGWYLYSFFGETGLELGLNEDGVSNYCNWNAVGTTIEGIDVAQGMLRIAEHPAFLNCTDEVFVDGVKKGSIIAGVSGVWNANTIEEVWGENYGATKLPTYTCAEQQIQMASFAGYKMVGVNDYSNQIEWAHKLAQWMTSEENQILRFTQRGQGPSNIEASTDPQIVESPAIQALLKQSEFSSLQRINSQYWEPVELFGKRIAQGNLNEAKLQELLDQMTSGITSAYHLVN